jgi:lipopolysaccharide transport system ATP-binding protein
MNDVAISVEKLGKAYRIGVKEEIPDSLIGAALNMAKAPLRNLHRLRRLNTFDVSTDSDAEADVDTIWALKDVSFTVKQGEVVGIIGRNGAGKSTLLKILSRITEPTCGRAVIRGRVSSLLEVGTGFHPELSGRENVYMNGTILGMTKREIDSKFDEIAGFSGVEKFLDTPVKRYSSGMKVRLAFAVAAHLEPEILIIDEVLAVGDAEFQRRCLGKMQAVAASGRTVLFVSHDLTAISNLCSTSYLIAAGAVKAHGPPQEVIGQYYATMPRDSNSRLEDSANRRGNGRLRFTEITVSCPNLANAVAMLSTGQPADFVLKANCIDDKVIDDLTIAIVVLDSQRNPICTLNTAFVNKRFGQVSQQSQFSCHVEKLPLSHGKYYIKLWCAADNEEVDVIDCATSFDVVEGDFFGTGRTVKPQFHGPFLVEHDWN